MTSSKNHVTSHYLSTKLGVQILTILAMVAVAYVVGIPIPVVAAAALTIFMTTFIITRRRRLGKKQMVGLVWFTLAALVLCILSVIREYVSPIRVTLLHIALLLLPPLFLIKDGTKPKE